MAKARSLFVCTECGAQAPRWMGQCPGCHAWNSLAEEVRGTGKTRRGVDGPERAGPRAEPVRLSVVEGLGRRRWTTGIDDLDFVLGGGVVPGSLVLLGGAPGIGKSTLLLQVSGRLAGAGHTVLYVSGEESAYQVKLRAERLEEPTEDLLMVAETSTEEILAIVEAAAPDILVVDSIQTLYTERLDGAPGGVGQVREVASMLQRAAKSREMATFIVGHVTKGGGIAGPRTLEHIVDVVLQFEASHGLEHRFVRGTKNRFGATDEIAVFRMGSTGLRPVENPSALFLEGRQARASGSTVAAAVEGSRPVLVEVQALTNPTVYGSPQRVSTGFDGRRTALLLAVLERRAGIPTGDLDVFLNVVGGLRLTEPAADLAVIAALASAVRDSAADPAAVFVGEVGLGGEIRPVGQLDRRLDEAGRLGFERAYVAGSGAGAGSDAVEVVDVRDLGQLVDAAFR